jgi:hypothetical protein
MRRACTLLLPALLAAAACSPPPPPTGQTRADAATLAACREHANAVYARQNRDAIYTIDNRDAPFSANSTMGVIDRGLPQRFGYQAGIRDCVRNTGTETDRTPPPAGETSTPR